jgi:Flp pilus assembly protein TadG
MVMLTTICRFLRRLRADKFGNALPIIAASLIPLAALIGSGLDVSRTYMAKSRLQSACDAASLSARREMRNDQLTTGVIDVGKRYFAFNFTQGMYDTDAFDPVVSKPETGLIRVSASTRIHTTVMKLFGFSTLPINVSCDASLNFVNTDVVLVLDVTGSMADSVGGTPKIQALRDAVMALYDELAPVQTQLESQGLRLRYGIVPYSSTVNVGRLIYDADPSYIRDTTPIQSRVANMTAATYVANSPTTAPGAWEYYNGSSGAGQSTPHPSATRSNSQCQSWVNSSSVNGGGPAPTATTVTSYDGSSSSSSYNASSDWGWSGAPVTSGSNRSCRRWKIVTTTTYQAVRGFTNWTYRQVNYDTSSYKTPGGSMTIATNGNGTVPDPGGTFNLQQLAAVGTGMSTTTVAWNGCIEERDTTTSIDGGTSLSIPSDAFDLDIDRIPDSDATRWRPMLSQALYTRTAGSTSTTVNGATSTSGWMMNNAASSGYYACPTESRRLAQWSRDSMQSYVDSLQPIGGTYHDIGMLWGARLISTGGIFADGCDEYNGMPCNRHIIFMTDGDQTTYCNVHTAYGVEQNDMRTTGSGSCSNQLARHQQRFRMICNAAKNMNASVWVIAFDNALNANLIGCASNSDQASTSSNSDDLIAKFRQIGNQIGALRLTR